MFEFLWRRHSEAAIAIAVACALLSGCSATYQPSACSALDPEEYAETYDPLESLNRSFFAFNVAVDDAILEPVARAYQDHVPLIVRNRVTDFTNYLKEPRNLASSALQGRLDDSATVAYRFTVNTFVGLVGTIDVAGHAGVEYQDHDFGHMLGRWGFGDGTYVVWPLFGPSNTRDSVGNLINYTQLNVTKEISSSDLQIGVQLSRAVNNRARLLPFTDIVDQQPDPYIFVRESYRQNRLDQICNS